MYRISYDSLSHRKSCKAGCHLQYSRKVIFHSGGNIKKVMDDLVACEIDGINPPVVKTENAITLFRDAKKYGT